MVMDRETIHLLLSRGLDGDLSRKEMVQLYQLVADNPSLTEEMGELAQLQERLDRLSEVVGTQRPEGDLAARILGVVAAERRQKRTLFSLIGGLSKWLLSPKGLAVQPFSFAGGVLAAVMVVWLNPPSLGIINQGKVETIAARLAIHDVQFVKAKARVDWTNQFIIPPDSSTRLALDESQESVHIQFETVESTRLTIIHNSLTRGEEAQRSFVVTGIGYATLRHPRSGDSVSIENSGQVPVLVYMRNTEGVIVSDHSSGTISRSL